MTLVLDEQGTVLLVNRAGCEVLGRSKEDIIGENWFEQFLPPRLRDQVERIHDQTINSVQRVLTELRPALLDDLGLVAVVRKGLKAILEEEFDMSL